LEAKNISLLGVEYNVSVSTVLEKSLFPFHGRCQEAESERAPRDIGTFPDAES